MIDYTTLAGAAAKFYLVGDDPGLAAPSGRGPRTFAGVAYSGGIVTDQSYWDAVAFDLDGLEFAPDRMPVLRDHDSTRIVGYTTGHSKAGRLEVRGTLLEGSGEAAEVAGMADQGYPWQLSVHIVPDSVENLERGDSAVVNGRRMDGPLAIFRRSAVREVSFCAVGADRGTSATVFAVGENKHSEVVMTEKNVKPEPGVQTAPGGGDRDLAIKTLSDERTSFAARCRELESEKGKLLAEAAEIRAENKTLSFELSNLKDSLERARDELERLRAERSEFTRASRAVLLAEDYRRLGLEIDPDSKPMRAVLEADEAVFEAFRGSLAAVKRAPAEPPAGAFVNVSGNGPEEDGVFAAAPKAPIKPLSERAKDVREEARARMAAAREVN
jgi:regulator of replication initiation timing